MVSPTRIQATGRLPFAWVALQVKRNSQFAFCHFLLIAPGICW